MTLIFDLRRTRAIRQFSDYVVEVGGLSFLPSVTLKAYLRKQYGHPNAVAFAVEVLGDQVSLKLSASQTAALQSGTYVWDLVAESDAGNIRLAEGVAIVKPGVTQGEALPPPPFEQAISQYSNPFQAAISLSALRVAALDSTSRLVYGSSDLPAQALSVLGVTTGAVTAGDAARVLLEGTLTDSSWIWQLGQPIFLGINGLLTQIPPNTGFLLKVARPLSANQIYVELENPILL